MPTLAPAASTTAIDAWRWTRWLPLAAALGLALAATLLRTCEIDAEADHYHERAEQLLAGHVVFDRFHPFGYITLVAAVHSFVANSLLAGCLVSAAAAGVLVWSTGAIAEVLRAGAGGPARLIASTNAVFWVFGTMASSDMTAAAVATAGLAVLLSAQVEPSGRRCLAVGLLLGFAVATRFSAVATVLPIAGWTFAVSPRLRTAIAIGLGLVIGFLPQAVLGAIATGSPLHSDNWHLLVLKVICDESIERLQHLYRTNTLPTLAGFVNTHLGLVVQRGLQDTVTAVVSVLPGMLAGSRTPVPGLQVWPLVLAMAGLCSAAHRRKTGVAVAGLAGLVALAVCTTFSPRARPLLGVLPFLVVGLAVASVAVARRSKLGWSLLGLLWLVVSAHGVLRYRACLAEQPEQEVEVLRRLPQLLPRPIVILATFPSARRHARAVTWCYMADAFGTAEATWNGVRERMLACGANVFLTGQRSNPHVHRHLVDGDVPPDFRRLLADHDVVLVERVSPPTDWIEDLVVTPKTVRAGEVANFDLLLSATAESAAVAAAGALLRDPSGGHQLLDLPSNGERIYRRQFVTPAIMGVWMAEPFVLRADGRFLRGKVSTLTVSR